MTSTGFTKEQKTELQVKVERMGGIYSNAFHDGVTHIICSLVRFVSTIFRLREAGGDFKLVYGIFFASN